jgi:N-acetylglutamate synthase/N-acetylornithine aminotransferase
MKNDEIAVRVTPGARCVGDRLDVRFSHDYVRINADYRS